MPSWTGILLNNRASIPEEFGTPEQYIKPDMGGRAWESCMTFHNAWGYMPVDHR